MLKITDKGFKYTPSFDTDLKKKFAKLIADLKRAEKPAKTSNVAPIQRRAIK